MTIGVFPAIGALADFSGTDIPLGSQAGASDGSHDDFKVIALGENSHAEQVRTLAPGIKIKGPFG